LNLALIGLLIVAAVSPAYADADVSMLEPDADEAMSWVFEPLQVSIQAGQAITWTNTGAVGHTATAAGGTFDTGLLAPGESKTVALAAPGTYEYLCTPHPWMKGTIIVAAAGAAQPTTQPLATTQPVPTVAAVAKPAAQPVATPTPFRLVTTTTVSTPAPRAGSLPIDDALPLVAAGATVAAAGVYLLRRRR